MVGVASRRSPRKSSMKNNFVCINGGQASVQLQTREVPSPGGNAGNACRAKEATADPEKQVRLLNFGFSLGFDCLGNFKTAEAKIEGSSAATPLPLLRRPPQVQR